MTEVDEKEAQATAAPAPDQEQQEPAGEEALTATEEQPEAVAEAPSVSAAEAPVEAEVAPAPAVQPEETGEEAGEEVPEPQVAAPVEVESAPAPVAAEDGAQPEQDFGTVLAEYEEHQAQESPAAAPEGPQRGEKITGKIVSVGEEAVFVDFGAKAEGQIPRAELENEEGELTVAVGDEITALLTAADSAAGGYQLHARVGDWAESLDDLKLAHEFDLPVEGMVTGVNKGGVEVKLAGIRAFCPLSQLELSRVEDPFPYANRRLVFKVLRIEDGKKRRRPNVVLSRRALLEETARERAQEAREQLELGSVVTGKITSLASYGAFVDLGGVEGLLHVSEIDHTRVGHPKEVLSEGQEVTVKVIKIEKGKGRSGRERLSLSRKILIDDPWKEAAKQFPEGEVIQGTVVRLAPFGAFVELAPGIDGLVHVSELDAGKRVSHPREAVKPGQQVEVTVLKVDRDKRRISLSMKPGAIAEVEVAGGSYESSPSGTFGSLGDFFKTSKIVTRK